MTAGWGRRGGVGSYSFFVYVSWVLDVSRCRNCTDLDLQTQLYRLLLCRLRLFKLINMFLYSSMIDTYSDELGLLDFKRSQNGSGMSKKAQVSHTYTYSLIDFTYLFLSSHISILLSLTLSLWKKYATSRLLMSSLPCQALCPVKTMSAANYIPCTSSRYHYVTKCYQNWSEIKLYWGFMFLLYKCTWC